MKTWNVTIYYRARKWIMVVAGATARSALKQSMAAFASYYDGGPVRVSVMQRKGGS